MVAPRMGIYIYLYMLTDRGSKVDNLSVGLAAVPHRQEGRGLQHLTLDSESVCSLARQHRCSKCQLPSPLYVNRARFK